MQLKDAEKVHTEFLGLSLEALESLCSQQGVSAMHAKDLFREAYKEGSSKPWFKEGIPKKFAEFSEGFFAKPQMRIFKQFESSYDGSVKFVLELKDGRQVEMVLMPESKRVTLCVSSQVGCAQGCVFCHTGRMGLLRNLSSAEIVEQVWLANNWISAHADWLQTNKLPATQKITNIVFMGMGEPLDNVEGVANAIKILTNPFGYNLALRRISVSTAGHLDGMDALLQLIPDVRLAISVHSAFDAERTKIMPINRRWPLAELIAKLKATETHIKNGLLLQYTLISNVNDSLNHARELVKLISGMNVKVNIIPLNPVGPSRLKSPEIYQLESFRDEIYKAGIRVMVRYSKGQDIAAACGQLVASQK